MFLHSGAALHGHQFSPEARPHPRRRSTLTRSAFSAPVRIPPASFIIPSRSLSDSIPRTNEHVRFQEPVISEVDTMSDTGSVADSVAGSVASSGVNAVGNAVAGAKKQRRESCRSKQRFVLAKPAPTLTSTQHLICIRPRTLLQLQLVSSSHIVPALDARVDTRVLPRLAKRFPRAFRAKWQLGPNDVMILKYSNDFQDAEEPEEAADDNLIAVICQMPKDSGGSLGKAEIVLNNEVTWTATPSSRRFEFVSVDVKTKVITTAQWARVKSKSGTERLAFSIMHSHTQHHPIMAYLENGTLDIKDEYITTSSSRPASTLFRKYEGDEPVEVEPTTFLITEELKTLIKVTAIWVGLRQGLSPSFKYTGENISTASVNSHGRSRSQTQTPVPSLANASINGSFRKSCASPTNSAPRQLDGSPASPRRIPSTGTRQRTTNRAVGIPSTVLSDNLGERDEKLATDDAVESCGSEVPAVKSDRNPDIKPSRWRRMKNRLKKQFSR